MLSLGQKFYKITEVWLTFMFFLQILYAILFHLSIKALRSLETNIHITLGVLIAFQFCSFATPSRFIRKLKNNLNPLTSPNFNFGQFLTSFLYDAKTMCGSPYLCLNKYLLPLCISVILAIFSFDLESTFPLPL